jgi:hypothetical protein
MYLVYYILFSQGNGMPLFTLQDTSKPIITIVLYFILGLLYIIILPVFY